MNALVKSEDGKTYYKEVRTTNTTIAELHARDRRRLLSFSIVAGGFAFSCLIFAVAVWWRYGIPAQPYILRVDNAGNIDVVSVVKTRVDSWGELIDQKHLSDYVTHRETYNWWYVQDDYDAIGYMSTEAVANEYVKTYFNGDESRVKKLADKVAIVVKIETMPVVSPETHTATVRYQTIRHVPNQPDQVGHWVATIAYTYAGATMDVNARKVNPLGFLVTSYRTDAELGVPQ